MFERFMVNCLVFWHGLFDSIRGPEEYKSILESTRIIHKGNCVELTWDCGCKPLDHRPETHNAQIIAIDGSWFVSPLDSTQMDAQPDVGRKYYMEIQPPWYLQLRQEIWIIHTSDSVCDNGWLRPQHLEETLYCKAKIERFFKKSEHECLVEITVMKTVQLDEFSTLLEQTIAPSRLTNFITHPPNDFEIVQMGDHFCASWNAEGDIGETLLILKMPNSEAYFAPYYSYFNHCHGLVIGGNYLISDEIMHVVRSYKPTQTPST